MKASPTLHKLSGAGNTIVVIDDSQGSAWRKWQARQRLSRKKLARIICSHHQGAGADGILFIRKSVGRQNEYIWDFFNADGSNAEMCGNAARCAALFVSQKIKSSKRMMFHTKAGLVCAEILPNKKIKVEMTPVYSDGKVRKIPGTSTRGVFVNTGVPHFVIVVDSLIEREKLRTLARSIRRNKVFAPKGTNITLIKKSAGKTVQAMTYERGVEDFTLACGTGAVAAAYVQSQSVGAKEISVLMPGGRLRVSLSKNTKGRPLLTGEASLISEFKIFNGEFR